MTVATRGRPRRTGPVTETDRERGRRIAAWIRSGMMPPHQKIEFTAADIAKLTGLSKSGIGNYLNDCYDKASDRMKFPKDENIEKIAQALSLNPDDGKAARYWVPKPIRRGGEPQIKRVIVGEWQGKAVEVTLPDTVSDAAIDSIGDFIRFKLSEDSAA